MWCFYWLPSSEEQVWEKRAVASAVALLFSQKCRNRWWLTIAVLWYGGHNRTGSSRQTDTLAVVCSWLCDRLLTGWLVHFVLPTSVVYHTSTIGSTGDDDDGLTPCCHHCHRIYQWFSARCTRHSSPSFFFCCLFWYAPLAYHCPPLDISISICYFCFNLVLLLMSPANLLNHLPRTRSVYCASLVFCALTAEEGALWFAVDLSNIFWRFGLLICYTVSAILNFLVSTTAISIAFSFTKIYLLSLLTF